MALRHKKRLFGEEKFWGIAPGEFLAFGEKPSGALTNNRIAGRGQTAHKLGSKLRADVVDPTIESNQPVRRPESFRFGADTSAQTNRARAFQRDVVERPQDLRFGDVQLQVGEQAAGGGWGSPQAREEVRSRIAAAQAPIDAERAETRRQQLREETQADELARIRARFQEPARIKGETALETERLKGKTALEQERIRRETVLDKAKFDNAADIAGIDKKTAGELRIAELEFKSVEDRERIKAEGSQAVARIQAGTERQGDRLKAIQGLRTDLTDLVLASAKSESPSVMRALIGEIRRTREQMATLEAGGSDADSRGRGEETDDSGVLRDEATVFRDTNGNNIPDAEEDRFQQALAAEAAFNALENPTPQERANFERAMLFKKSYLTKYKQFLDQQ